MLLLSKADPNLGCLLHTKGGSSDPSDPFIYPTGSSSDQALADDTEDKGIYLNDAFII